MLFITRKCFLNRNLYQYLEMTAWKGKQEKEDMIPCRAKWFLLFFLSYEKYQWHLKQWKRKSHSKFKSFARHRFFLERANQCKIKAGTEPRLLSEESAVSLTSSSTKLDLHGIPRGRHGAVSFPPLSVTAVAPTTLPPLSETAMTAALFIKLRNRIF